MPSLVRGTWLAGGSTPSATQFSSATSSARLTGVTSRRCTGLAAGNASLILLLPKWSAAGDQVRANVGVLGQVPAGVRVDVQQRAVAVPVLGRAVGEDHLRHAAELALPGQQIGSAERAPGAEPVGLRDRRLGVAVVELAACGAREVAEHAVENRHPGLVDVQALGQELAKQPPGLGDAVGEGVVDAVGAQVRHDVADRQQAAAGDGRQRSSGTPARTSGRAGIRRPPRRVSRR